MLVFVVSQSGREVIKGGVEISGNVIHHPKFSHECTLCNKRFKTMKLVNGHLGTVHNKLIEPVQRGRPRIHQTESSQKRAKNKSWHEHNQRKHIAAGLIRDFEGLNWDRQNAEEEEEVAEEEDEEEVEVAEEEKEDDEEEEKEEVVEIEQQEENKRLWTLPRLLKPLCIDLEFGSQEGDASISSAASIFACTTMWHKRLAPNHPRIHHHQGSPSVANHHRTLQCRCVEALMFASSCGIGGDWSGFAVLLNLLPSLCVVHVLILLSLMCMKQ